MINPLEENDLSPEEQKGCSNNSYSFKGQLPDQESYNDIRNKAKDINIAWIDYRKAFDLLTYILETLVMSTIQAVLLRYQKHSMNKL